MQQNLEIVLSVDARTGDISVVLTQFDSLKTEAAQTSSAIGRIKNTISDLGSSVGKIISLKQAFDFVMHSGLEYNKTMDASKAKLTAIVLASKGLTLTTGQQVTAMERQKLVSGEVAAMMSLLEKTSTKTGRGMSELVDIYALAKPGMERNNWALKDQADILKLVTNSASNLNLSTDDLSAGINDMADGTWDANSGFGKMMQTLGVTKESYAAAGDKVAFLKEKLSETGTEQDTYAYAMSNLSTTWDMFAGKITQPIFDAQKDGAKELTRILNDLGPEAASIGQSVTGTFVTMAGDIYDTFSYLPQAIVVVGEGISDALGGALDFLQIKDEVNGVLDLIAALGVHVGSTAQLAGLGFLNMGATLRVGFYEVVLGIEDGINVIGDGWNSLTVSMQNTFKFVVDAIGEGFYAMINGLLRVVSEFINSFSSGFDNVFALAGKENPFKPIVISIGSYESSIEAATKSTKKLIDTGSTNASLNEAYKTQATTADAIADTWKKIASGTGKVTKETAKETASTKELSKATEDMGKKADESGKKGVNAAKEHASGVKNAASSTKDLESSYRKFLELTGQKEKLFELDAAEAKKEFEKLRAAGKMTAEDVAKANDAMWKKHHGGALDFTDEFKGLLGGVFKGDFSGAFKGFVDGVSSELVKPIVNNLSESLASTLSSGLNSLGGMSGNVFAMAIGVGLSFLSSSLTDTLTDAEKEAAKGRTDFSDESLANLKGIFESAQDPLLESTYQMTKYLASMDKNFVLIGKAISVAGSAGVDLTGADYKPSQSGGIWSSTSREMLSTGVIMGASSYDTFMDGVVQGYTTEIITKKKYFGLSTKQYTKDTVIDLTAEQQSYFTEAFQEGYDFIFEAIGTLGLGQYEDALKKVEVEIGKIDLEGLSPEEASKRIEAAYSEYFSGVLGGVGEIDRWVDKYGKAGEDGLETLGRLAVTYEQSSAQLEDIGVIIGDNIVKSHKTGNSMSTMAKSMSAAIQNGDMDAASSMAVQMASSMASFGKGWGKIYSAQEATLDVVEAAGGQDAFSSAMQSFQQNFLSDQEQYNIVKNNLESSAKTLGIKLPDTAEGFADLIQGFKVTDEESAKLYGELIALSPEYAKMIDMEQQLADKRQSALDSYISSFYSTEEQASMLAGDLQNSMNALGLTMPQTKEEFKNLVDSLSFSGNADTMTPKTKEEFNKLADSLGLSGAAGETLKDKLLELSPQFVELYDMEQQLNDTRQAALDSFIGSFYSTEEQASMLAGDLQNSMNALGLTMPQTKEEFKNLVDSLSFTGKTGETLKDKLLELSPQFAELYDMQQQLMDNEQQLADERAAAMQTLLDAKAAYTTPAKITASGIQKNIRSGVASEDVLSQIDTWANAEKDRLKELEQTRIDGINAEIEASNALRESILSAKESSMETLRSYTIGTVAQSQTLLSQAINNGDYAGVSGAYQNFAEKAQSSARNEAEFISMITKANADIQGIATPPEQALLENIDATLLKIDESVNASAIKMIDALIAREGGGTQPNTGKKISESDKKYITESAALLASTVANASTGTRRSSASTAQQLASTAAKASVSGSQDIKQSFGLLAPQLATAVDRVSTRSFQDMQKSMSSMVSQNMELIKTIKEMNAISAETLKTTKKNNFYTEVKARA